MKKTLLRGMIFVTAVSLASVRPAEAVTFEGSPDNNPDHFVWALMAELEAPDDPDCPSIAEAYLLGVGVPAQEAANASNYGCAGIASMKTHMQSGMQGGGGGQGAETNLFNAPNWHNVDDLYFRHSTNGVVDGQIAFSKPIDFMSYNFMNFMSHFGDNMDSRTGYISLDATSVGGFANYGATLTMYNVPDFDDPEILVNGREDENGIVSNLAYNREARTITFSAAHFTSFEVIESDDDTEKPDIDSVTYWKAFDKKKNKWMLKVALKGKHFTKGVKVTLSGKKASKVSRKTNKSVVATFPMEKLTGRKMFTIRAANGPEKDKFEKQLLISVATSKPKALK